MYFLSRTAALMAAAADAHGFPATAWTVLLAARDPAAPESAAAREAVCRAYWTPVFDYLRSLGLDHAPAEDIAQSVLAEFCHAGWIERVDRAQGRLRHFFKAAARNALYQFRRDAAALKRGGGVAPLALDELGESECPATVIPDAAFDRAWAWALFDRAMATLAESYTLRGKAPLFDALKPALISTDELQPYAAIGSSIGVEESQIRLEVHRLRRRLAERLRAEVAATLDPAAPPEQIEAEARYLVQLLANERAHG
jgi:DNA-directed RNA polymerase specialized sigma24 family protein